MSSQQADCKRPRNNDDRATTFSAVCLTHHVGILAWWTTAVSSSKSRGAHLEVPRLGAMLGGTTDGQRVDRVGVAITVTVVIESPAITRSPDKDWTQTTATLKQTEKLDSQHTAKALFFYINVLRWTYITKTRMRTLKNEAREKKKQFVAITSTAVHSSSIENVSEV